MRYLKRPVLLLGLLLSAGSVSVFGADPSGVQATPFALPNGPLLSYRDAKVVFMPLRAASTDDGCPGFTVFPTGDPIPPSQPCAGLEGVVERVDPRGALVVKVGETHYFANADKEVEGGVIAVKHYHMLRAGSSMRRTVAPAVNLLLASELERLRTSIEGRGVYLRDGKLFRYDRGRDSVDKIRVDPRDELQGVDFRASWSENTAEPVRLVFRTPFQEVGYLDVDPQDIGKYLSLHAPAVRERERDEREEEKPQPEPRHDDERRLAREEQLREAQLAEQLAREQERRAKDQQRERERELARQQDLEREREREAERRRKEEERELAKASEQEQAAEVSATPELSGDLKILWDVSSLHLVEWKLEHTRKNTVVTGKVRNISDQPIQQVVIKIAYFDAAGAPKGQRAGLVDAAPFAPGKEAQFEIISDLDEEVASCTIAFEEVGGEQLVTFANEYLR